MHIIQIQGTVVDLIISLPPETPCHLVCILSQPHIYLYLWAFALAVLSIWNAVPSPWLPQFYLSRSRSSPWVCSKLSLPAPAHVDLFLLEFSIVWNSVMIFLFLQSQVARLLSERWGKDAGKQKQQPSQLSTLLGTCHTKHMTTVHSAENLPHATIWPSFAFCGPLFWEENAMKAHTDICQLYVPNDTILWSWHSGTRQFLLVWSTVSSASNHPWYSDVLSFERCSYT